MPIADATPPAPHPEQRSGCECHHRVLVLNSVPLLFQGVDELGRLHYWQPAAWSTPPKPPWSPHSSQAFRLDNEGAQRLGIEEEPQIQSN